ncbi:hypothetical protein OAI84_00625, partial [bacterium]|nr:hypothetical protein [bacterium]
ALSHLKNVYLLQENFFEFDNFIIAGTTLWPYISNKFFSGNKCMLSNGFIRYNNKLWIEPKITNPISLRQKQWLENIILGNPHKAKIIITHFLPSQKCMDPKLKFSLTSKSLYSNCDNLLDHTDVWCCGKRVIHKKISGCHIYMNACGYLWENTDYKKDFVF